MWNNPVFRYELRGWRCWRRWPGWAKGLGAGLVTVAIWGYGRGLLGLAESLTSRGYVWEWWQGLTYLLLFALLVLAPGLTANAITGERERRTLDLLLTTRLSSAEIVKGKLYARLVPLGGLLLLYLPFAVLCGLKGVPWVAVGGTLLFLPLCGLAGTNIGLYCSTVSRKTATATALAYAIVLGLLMVSVGEMLWSVRVWRGSPWDPILNPFFTLSGLYSALRGRDLGLTAWPLGFLFYGLLALGGPRYIISRFGRQEG